MSALDNSQSLYREPKCSVFSMIDWSLVFLQGNSECIQKRDLRTKLSNTILVPSFFQRPLWLFTSIRSSWSRVAERHRRLKSTMRKLQIHSLGPKTRQSHKDPSKIPFRLKKGSLWWYLRRHFARVWIDSTYASLPESQTLYYSRSVITSQTISHRTNT